MDDLDLSYFDREVLDRLSPLEWKTAGEISVEIGQQRWREGRRRIALFLVSLIDPEMAKLLVLEANLGKLWIALSKFESAGWIASRWRSEPPEKTARRGGHRLREYHLTEDGHHARARIPSESTSEGKLLPAPI